jgi:hypothetical protein
MKSGKNKLVLFLVLVLALLSVMISGCGNSASQSIAVSQLISQADKYKGKTVTFEAFYFGGFEISALAESVGPANSGVWRIVPNGTLIWVKSGISQELHDKFYKQTDTPSGYTEYIGKLKVSGIFETGGKYGHMDAYHYQMAITSAELLEWSPPPAATQTTATGELQFKVVDSSDQPLQGAKVVSEEEPEGQLKLTGLTDASGIVVFKDIKAGEYKFYISRFDYTQQNNITAVVSSYYGTSLTISLSSSG